MPSYLAPSRPRRTESDPDGASSALQTLTSTTLFALNQSPHFSRILRELQMAGSVFCTRDEEDSFDYSTLSAIYLPLITRSLSPCPSPRKKRSKFAMLSKKPMELVSVVLPQSTRSAAIDPIQLRTDSGRTILHEKAGFHLDNSIHGDHPSPPRSPHDVSPPDPALSVRSIILLIYATPLCWVILFSGFPSLMTVQVFQAKILFRVACTRVPKRIRANVSAPPSSFNEFQLFIDCPCSSLRLTINISLTSLTIVLLTISTGHQPSFWPKELNFGANHTS